MILAIYGTNGSGKEIYDLAMIVDRWEKIVFINDYEKEGIFMDCPRMPFEVFQQSYPAETTEVCIAVGEPAVKKLLYDRLKEKSYRLATIIAPTAIISPTAQIGEGVVVRHHTIISSEAVVHDNVYIQSNAIIGHNVEIESHCQISSYVHISGNTRIGEGVYIGIHCPIREKISVGKYSILSMGAVVLKDVPEEVVVMGNPARVIAKNVEHKVFK